MKLIQILITFALFIFLAVVTAKFATKRWEGNTSKLTTVGVILAIISAAGSVFIHGLGMHNIKTVILFCVFLYASYGDIKTHEADDFIHIIVFTAAMIAKSAVEIPAGILSAILIGGTMLLVAVLIPGAGIGGADIKFAAACAFLSDVTGGFFGLGLGAFIGLLCNSPFRKKKEREEAPKAFPMLPYLSCSYMLIFLLSF